MNKHNLRDVAIIGGTLLTMTLVLPVVDSVSNLIQSIINAKINTVQLNVELDNKEVQAMLNPSSTQVVGFHIPDEGE